MTIRLSNNQKINSAKRAINALRNLKAMLGIVDEPGPSATQKQWTYYYSWSRVIDFYICYLSEICTSADKTTEVVESLIAHYRESLDEVTEGEFKFTTQSLLLQAMCNQFIDSEDPEIERAVLPVIKWLTIEGKIIGEDLLGWKRLS